MSQIVTEDYDNYQEICDDFPNVVKHLIIGIIIILGDTQVMAQKHNDFTARRNDVESILISTVTKTKVTIWEEFV